MSAYSLADSKPARLGHGSLVLGLAGLLLALLLIWGLRQQAVRLLQGRHAQAAEQLAQALVLARPAAVDLPGFLAGWPGPQGRVALGAFPVRTADGRQLHLDCPLRVALSAESL